MKCSDMFVYYIKDDLLEDVRATTEQTNWPVVADVRFVPLFEKGCNLRHFSTSGLSIFVDAGLEG